MFNLTKVGNRVDIFSSGIDFRITGAYISGTSYKYANIEAIGYDWEVTASGITGTASYWANIKLVVGGTLLRNSFSYYDVYASAEIPGVVGSLEYTASKNTSGILNTATTTNIHTKDGSASSTSMYPGSVVRNGDYIYICDWLEDDPDDGPWHSRVLEYQISTGNKNYITYFSDDNSSSNSSIGMNNYISIIEGRKLLVFDMNCTHYPDEDPAIYRVYIVDFDANTSTEQLAIPYVSDPNGSDWWYFHQLESSCVIKDDAGDIHLLVSCKYMNDHLAISPGWRIYHKNYTDNTAWTNVDVNDDFGTPYTFHRSTYPYVISNNRYLCILASIPTGAGKTTYCIYVYDILNNTLDYVHGADDLSTGPWNILQAMEDGTNHKIYIVASYVYPYVWNTYEFDPATMTFNETPIVGGSLFQSASNTHLYDWNTSQEVHRTYDQDLQPYTNTRPAIIENQSNLMDNSSNSIWYLDSATLKKFNFTTGVIERSIATGITAEVLGIIHLGNCLVITAQTDAGGYIMNYYLVT